MPFAKPEIQKAVKDIKGMRLRSDKQKHLANMAVAFAQQGWDHKAFKSIEALEEERSRSKNTMAMPKVIMRAKCGGEAQFQQAQLPHSQFMPWCGCGNLALC